jgi:hypothetical protein
MSNGNNNHSGLILPGQDKELVDLQLQRVEVGGLEVDIQPDPRIAVSLQAAGFGIVGILIGSPPQMLYCLSKPENLLNILAAHMNIQNALIRECVQLRTALVELADAGDAKATAEAPA